MEINNKDIMINSASPPAGGVTISGSSSMKTPFKHVDDIDCLSPPVRAAISESSSMETPSSGMVDSEIGKLFTKLTPPKIAEGECHKLAARFKIEWDLCNDDEKRVLCFLFDRNVHKVLEEELKEDSGCDSAVGDKLKQAMDASSDIGERVRVIVEERGQCFSDNVPDDVQKYDDFLLDHPAWRARVNGIPQPGDVFINLLEEPYRLKVFQQVQLSGYCYLHAAVLAYHYYARWHELYNAEYHIIDIPRFMRHTFTNKDIYKHLFQGAGGHSGDTLVRLAGGSIHHRGGCLVKGSCPILQSREVRRLVEDMTLYGPLLFSNALLPEDFGSGSHSFSGKTSTFKIEEGQGILEERHAMVLMGIQKDEEDNWLFLFQNSHQENQFFEADYDWVACSMGSTYANIVPKRGEWRLPSHDKPYIYDKFAVYSQASPSVDRPDSSFTFSTGTEY